MKKAINTILLSSLVAMSFNSCNMDEEYLGNWINKENQMPAKGRAGATCFVIDDKAYLVGGRGHYKTEVYYLDTWQFDPDTYSWTQFDTVPAPKGRWQGVGFAIDGKGYYGTGRGKSGVYFKDFYEFDPSQPAGSQWKVTDSMPGEPIYGMIGFSINGVGYAGTGDTKSMGYCNTFYEYHPEKADGEKWSIVPNINPTKRSLGSVFVIDDRAYIIGGISNSVYVESFERFDPSYEKGENRWYKISQDFNYDYRSSKYLKIRRYGAAAFSINGRGYLCCGYSGAAKSDVWEYIPFVGRDNLGKWTEVCSFEGQARHSCQGFAVGQTGYVLCGASNINYTSDGDFLDDIYMFHPQEDYDELRSR